MALKSMKKTTAQVDQQPHPAQLRKQVIGVVVSDKMQKTIVVEVKRQVRHPLYKKYVNKTRRFKAHDEKRDAKVGDLVFLVESRPLSKTKRWALREVIRRGNLAAAVE